jgi:charged multivesicular body protein 1
MTSVVRGMDKAMETMNLERVRLSPLTLRNPSPYFIPDTEPRTDSTLQQISLVMDKFETQFSDLDVQTSYMEDTMQSTTAVSTPQDQIDLLMKQMADEANIELEHELGERALPDLNSADKSKVGEEDVNLAQRLRALRPAS